MPDSRPRHITREQPRERLADLGARALNLAELVAVLVGSGSAGASALDVGRAVSHAVSGSVRRLASLDATELEDIPGLGGAKSARIAAAMEIGRRAMAEPNEDGDYIRGGDDVYRRLGPRLGSALQEEFHVILLNARNRVIRECLVTRGTLDSSLVHPREVFRPAIIAGAAGLILVHNHPSGNPHPSPEDRAVTERLVEVGRLLGIPVVDHVVVGHDSWRSVLAEMPATVGW